MSLTWTNVLESHHPPIRKAFWALKTPETNDLADLNKGVQIGDFPNALQTVIADYLAPQQAENMAENKFLAAIESLRLLERDCSAADKPDCTSLLSDLKQNAWNAPHSKNLKLLCSRLWIHSLLWIHKVNLCKLTILHQNLILVTVTRLWLIIGTRWTDLKTLYIAICRGKIRNLWLLHQIHPGRRWIWLMKSNHGLSKFPDIQFIYWDRLSPPLNLTTCGSTQYNLQGVIWASSDPLQDFLNKIITQGLAT